MTLCKLNTIFCDKKSKSQEKEAGTNLIYYLGLDIWLNNSWKLICIDQSWFHYHSQPRELKNV